MKTDFELDQKTADLIEGIGQAREKKCTRAQSTAIDFAVRIVRGSGAVRLLSDSGFIIEAHAVCRLVFEHFFNLGALLHDEGHLELLFQHSKGEFARKIRKISQEEVDIPVLTKDNEKKVMGFLADPARKDDPKSGLNWEQIAKKGKTDCMYISYTSYSFNYAHSTLISNLQQVGPDTIADLQENLWTVLELARMLLRDKVVDASRVTRDAASES